MKLLVVRHAIAMERVDYQSQPGTDEGQRDDELRPLTAEGVRKMRKNAKGLRKLVREPGLILTSPLTRALQTTEILQAAWPGLHRFETRALEPGAHPDRLIDWFRQNKKFADDFAIVVGHEPQLSHLVSWLMAGASRPLLELKKGGACLIEFPKTPAKSKGELRWLVTPKILSI